MQRHPVFVSLLHQLVHAEPPLGSLQFHDDVLTRIRTVSYVDPSFALLVRKIGIELLVLLLQDLLDPVAASSPFPTRIQKPQVGEQVLLKNLLLFVGINEVLEFLDYVQTDLDYLAV